MSASEGKGLTVPKFSSFKSKLPAETSASSSASKAENGSEADQDKRERRRHHHSSRHERHYRDRRDRHHHRSEHRKKRRSESPVNNDKALVKTENTRDSLAHRVTENAGETGKDLFVIDKRGDPLIRKYHSIDRSQIPLYRRSGRGRILGSDGFLVIHREGPRVEFSIRMPGEGPSALRDRHLFQTKIDRIKPRRIKPLKDDELEHQASEEEDFVPFKASSKALMKKDEEALSEPEGPDYRSIEGKAKARDYSDSDLEYDSDEDHEDGLDADDPLRKTSVELARRVKDDPSDIVAWTQLIDHQDALLRAGIGARGDPTKAEIKSYAEIKISMYESALQNTPASSAQEERLLVGLMLEGAKVWPAAKLERRWDELIKRHGISFALWKTWLDQKLSNLSAFQYQDLKDIHVKRLHGLKASESHPDLPSPGSRYSDDPVTHFKQMVYIFLRTTRFMFDAGYRELAVAAWQAQLELSFHRPTQLESLSSAEVLERFQTFWENEAPRVGDEGALGWAHYAAEEDMAEGPEPLSDDNSVADSRDVYKSWGATELRRALTARRPARTLDEGADDDPYRVVMYSDIEDLLFIVPTNLFSQIQSSLANAFLLFCQLPLAIADCDWLKSASADPFIVGSSRKLGGSLEESPAYWTAASEEDAAGDARKCPDFGQDGAREVISLDLLFAGSNWFQYLAGWPAKDARHGGPADLSWVWRVTRQLVRTSPTEVLARYCLALGWTLDRQHTKKHAKGLLKQLPTSADLYAAYALAEWADGNMDTARSVLSSAANLALADNTASGQGALNLWISWAWLELSDGNKDKATLCLCAAAGSSSKDVRSAAAVSSPQLLGAIQSLSSHLGHCISLARYATACLYAQALMLLQYLTSDGGSESASTRQGNITAAMDRIWSVSSELKSRGVSSGTEHEALLQAGAKLLYHHACRGPFRSAYLRDQLRKYLRVYPDNTIFLSLFAWSSSSFGIDDPVRSLLHEETLVGANDCISSRIFAIRYELQQGNAHTTRAAFERAVNSPICKTNAELWRSYIKFCWARRELRSKAKEVFWRAIGQCPWSKELCLEAFLTLAKVMDEFELRSVFDTMNAKGLRIHVDLEEFVNARKQAKGRK